MSNVQESVFQREKKSLEESINPLRDCGIGLMTFKRGSTVCKALQLFPSTLVQLHRCGDFKLGSYGHHLNDLELKHNLSGTR